MAKPVKFPNGPFLLAALLYKSLEDEIDGKRSIRGIYSQTDPTGGPVKLLLMLAARETGSFVLSFEGIDPRGRPFELVTGFQGPLRLPGRQYTDVECNLHLPGLRPGTNWLLVRMDGRLMTAVPFEVVAPRLDRAAAVH